MKVIMVHPKLPDQEVETTDRQLRDVWSKRGWEKKPNPKKKARRQAAEEQPEKEI